jgi:type II secretory pathway component PulJ
MPTLSATPSETARKIGSNLLQRLASIGQATVATRLQVSESTVSRMKEKDAEIQRAAALLEALDMKAVPREMRCYDEKSLAAILELAKQRMAQIDQPSQLSWDDADAA